MINVLSLYDAHLGTTASELHAPLKQWGKSREENLILWQKVYYSVYQSIPSAAQQISIVALSGLSTVD